MKKPLAFLLLALVALSSGCATSNTWFAAKYYDANYETEVLRKHPFTPFPNGMRDIHTLWTWRLMPFNWLPNDK